MIYKLEQVYIHALANIMHTHVSVIHEIVQAYSCIMVFYSHNA